MFFTAILVAVLSVPGLQARDLTPLDPTAVRIDGTRHFRLFAKGEERIPVVFEDGPRSEAAAVYLVSVLEASAGGEWDRYRLPVGASNTISKCLFIPRPDNGDGFSVEVSEYGVRFSGRSDFAVYDFCERLLGVRHYWDGPGGRSVVKRTALELPFLRYSDSPVFSFRQYWPGGDSTWCRVAKGGGTFDRWTQCHTTEKGFCYGSPEGIREFCRRVDADIAGGERFGRVVDRERKTVSVSPYDAAYDCSCRWCRTLRSHRPLIAGQAAPILWDRFLPYLTKHLAEHHPDYQVCVLPYWNYVKAPVPTTVLGTNVYAEVCSISGLAAFKYDVAREYEEGLLRDWVKATGRKVANWHYSCWPAKYTPAAYVYGKTIASHYRRMRELTVGSFVCGGTNDFPRFSLSLYVWMRCLWNPEIDVDAVYDEFCTRQFGPAAEMMRELTEIQEEEWNPRSLRFSDETRERMAKLIDRAAEQVRNTPSAPTFHYYRQGFSGDFEFKRKEDQ